MNIWIQNNKSKTYTFEIVKNAMLRFTPKKVKVIDLTKNKLILSMDKLSESDCDDLGEIMQEINNLSYNGKLRTIKNNNEIKVITIKPIKKITLVSYWILEIDF